MTGRIIGPLFSTVLRLIALAFVWGMTLMILHKLILYSVAGGVGQDMIFMTLALLIPSGIIVSHQILRLRLMTNDAPRQQPSAQTQTQMRPSTDSPSMRDLMALLDDDDLDALRGEIRENLSARIQRLSGAEGESFEDLLADAGGKRKRK